MVVLAFTRGGVFTRPALWPDCFRTGKGAWTSPFARGGQPLHRRVVGRRRP